MNTGLSAGAQGCKLASVPGWVGPTGRKAQVKEKKKIKYLILGPEYGIMWQYIERINKHEY